MLDPLAEDQTLAAAGCENAFARMAIALRPRIVSFLIGRVGHLQDAEDIASDAINKAWLNRHKYDSRFQFTTWIYTIAKRAAIDHQRYSARRGAGRHVDDDVALASVAGREATPDQSLIAAEPQAENIWALASDKLTSDQYAALWLRYGEDMEVAEIASVLGKSQVGTRVLLHRARAKLEKELVSGELTS
ncbi:MAG: hypothetical protein Aurels2KO_45450 [Aureliella sp.]